MFVLKSVMNDIPVLNVAQMPQNIYCVIIPRFLSAQRLL